MGGWLLKLRDLPNAEESVHSAKPLMAYFRERVHTRDHGDIGQTRCQHFNRVRRRRRHRPHAYFTNVGRGGGVKQQPRVALPARFPASTRSQFNIPENEEFAFQESRGS